MKRMTNSFSRTSWFGVFKIVVVTVALIAAPPPLIWAQESGQLWTEPATGMVFIWVPPGCFDLGAGPWVKLSSKSELGQNPHELPADETPAHNVCVNGFWMGRTEVTQGQWRRIMGGNPSAFALSEDHPVDNVSWNDTQTFLQAMDRLGAQRFRLPTEAEWEYACRNRGQQEIYPGGVLGSQVGWCEANSGDRAHPVGSLPGNGLDLRDMSGNVYEWCEDVYSAEAYAVHLRDNPLITGGSRFRVMRGGSYMDDCGDGMRCGKRFYSVPEDRCNNSGFRVVRWR